jgi:hypothetical protein
VFMRPRLDSRFGTFTDMTCRRRLAEHQPPGHPALHAGLSEGALAPARTLRGSGGATEIVTEILGVSPEAWAVTRQGRSSVHARYDEH